MSKKLKKPDPRDFNLESFADLVSGKLAIVGEDAGTFEAFRSGLLASLAPMTPYECVIAENLISIEWELLQQRRMREAALRRTLRRAIDVAMSKLREAEYDAELAQLWEEHVSSGGGEHDWEEVPPFDEEAALDEAWDLFIRATSPEIDVREGAYAFISELGVEPIDLMSKAFRGLGNDSEYHDQKVQNLERRRREVKRDLDDLQRARPIEGTSDQA